MLPEASERHFLFNSARLTEHRVRIALADDVRRRKTISTPAKLGSPTSMRLLCWLPRAAGVTQPCCLLDPIRKVFKDRRSS